MDLLFSTVWALRRCGFCTSQPGRNLNFWPLLLRPIARTSARNSRLLSDPCPTHDSLSTDRTPTLKQPTAACPLWTSTHFLCQRTASWLLPLSFGFIPNLCLPIAVLKTPLIKFFVLQSLKIASCPAPTRLAPPHLFSFCCYHPCPLGPMPGSSFLPLYSSRATPSIWDPRVPAVPEGQPRILWSCVRVPSLAISLSPHCETSSTSTFGFSYLYLLLSYCIIMISHSYIIFSLTGYHLWIH